MITVQDIHIPIPGEEEAKAWITPFWYEVMEFYPTFLEKAKEQGIKEPYKVQPYMLAVAKELHRGGWRDEYTEDQLIQRCFQHFGLQWLAGYVDKYKTL